MTATAGEAGLSSIGGRQWLILVMVPLTTLLFGMTITLVNVVLPQMRGALSATQDQIAWVVTSNLVATAVATPMTGWLANRLGWRNAAVLFRDRLHRVLAPVRPGHQPGDAGALSRRPGPVRRADHADGPGHPAGDLPAPPARAGHDDVGRRQRDGPGNRPDPRQHDGRGLQLARRVLHDRAAGHRGHDVPSGSRCRSTRSATRPSFDWTGFIALSVAIAAAQLIIDRGQRLDWFEFDGDLDRGRHRRASCLWIFVVHSLTATRPFLDPRLLLDRNFSIGLMRLVRHGHAELHAHGAVPHPAARPARLSRQHRSACCWRRAASATGCRS